MQYLGAEEYYFYEGLHAGLALKNGPGLNYCLKGMFPVTSESMREKCIEAYTNGYITGNVFTIEEYDMLFVIEKPEKTTKFIKASEVNTTSNTNDDSPSDVTWN